MPDSPAGPFHPGELSVQRRAGVEASAFKIGRGIHSSVPEVAREFLVAQDLVIIGALDSDDRVWASPLIGADFIQVRDERSLDVRAIPASGDPLHEALAVGDPVGMLAIDIESRRRMRVNGTVTERTGSHFAIHTHEVYSNCPKYIQRRARGERFEPADPLPPRIENNRLSSEDRNLVERADTFFIATFAPGHGADASHRGGAPGFITVRSDVELVWPDYSGNRMFNTLGNLAVDGRAALAFFDYSTGDVLHLTGKAVTLWDDERQSDIAGADRLVSFHVERSLRRPAALPWRWGAPEYSPFLPG